MGEISPTLATIYEITVTIGCCRCRIRQRLGSGLGLKASRVSAAPIGLGTISNNGAMLFNAVNPRLQHIIYGTEPSAAWSPAQCRSYYRYRDKLELFHPLVFDPSRFCCTNSSTCRVVTVYQVQYTVPGKYFVHVQKATNERSDLFCSCLFQRMGQHLISSADSCTMTTIPTVARFGRNASDW